MKLDKFHLSFNQPQLNMAVTSKQSCCALDSPESRAAIANLHTTNQNLIM